MARKKRARVTKDINSILLILIGLFLTIDGFFIHGLIYDYSILNLEWLDPFLNHAFIGLLFVVAGVLNIIRQGNVSYLRRK